MSGDISAHASRTEATSEWNLNHKDHKDHEEHKGIQGKPGAREGFPDHPGQSHAWP